MSRVLLLCENASFVAQISNHLIANGHTVINSTSFPTTISKTTYDHCWVLYFGPLGGGTGEPTATNRTKLRNFMAEGGIVLLFTDHPYGLTGNASYLTNVAVKEFVKSIVPPAVVPVEPFPYIELNSNSMATQIAWNTVNAASFGLDTTPGLNVNNTAVIFDANLLGGTGLLYCVGYPDQWSIVGYNGSDLQAAYQPGMLIVLLDRANCFGGDFILQTISTGFFLSILGYEGVTLPIYSVSASLKSEHEMFYDAAYIDQPYVSLNAEINSLSFLSSQTDIYNLIIKSDDVYLRSKDGSGNINYISGIPESKQFSKITDLMQYLLQNASSYEDADINIHLEGNVLFPYDVGDTTFNLSGFSESAIKSFNFMTYSRELSSGAATLLYDKSLVNQDEATGSVRIDQLKLFLTPGEIPGSLINGLNIDELNIANSIVEVIDGLSSDMSTASVVKFINSMLIAHPSSNTLQITQSSGGDSIMANSIVLVSEQVDIDISFLDNAISDSIKNSAAYNYETGYTVALPTMPGGDNIINQDPKILQNPFDTAGEPYNYDYTSVYGSPLINSGDNTLYYQNESSGFDIDGRMRIFTNKNIDRSPYESQILRSFFFSDDILRLFQDKVIFTSVPDPKFTIKSTGDNLDDLYYSIEIDSSITDKDAYWNEFFRGSKCIMQLRDFTRIVEAEYDKEDIKIGEFEAHFDAGNRMIIFRKTSSALSNMFSPQYNNGRYKYYYDGDNFKLSVYINNTYYKGASGPRNPVNINKFGGNTVIA